MRRGDLNGVALGVVRQDEVNADVIVVDLTVGKLSRASVHLMGLKVIRERRHTGDLTVPIRAGRTEGGAFGSSAVATGNAAAGTGMVAGICAATVLSLKFDRRFGKVV